VGSPGYKEIGQHIRVIEEALLARMDELGVAHVSCRYSDFWGRCGAHPVQRAESEADVEAFTERKVARRCRSRRGSAICSARDDQRMWRGNGDRREVEIAIKRRGHGGADGARRAGGRAPARDAGPRRQRSIRRSGAYDAVIGPYDEGSRELHVRLDTAIHAPRACAPTTWRG
jgi:hypothetical protein